MPRPVSGRGTVDRIDSLRGNALLLLDDRLLLLLLGLRLLRT
jgi:hypothetical protein